MRFQAPRNAGYIAIVREEERQYFNDGRSRLIRPQLYADFAEESFDETYRGPEGEGDYTAMAGGGFFDSESAQQRHGWTDEERKAVEERLLEIERTDHDVQQWKPTLPTPPWPTYDDVHHSQIAKLAEQLGFVEQALMYEQRTKRRESVLARLQELADQVNAEDALTAA